MAVLRSNESSQRPLGGTRELAEQGLRFGLAGGIVALVYLASTSLLAEVAGLAFQAALAIGFVLAISVHFTLQRKFVWATEHGFAIPLHHQAARYLFVAGVQYGLTALATGLLPGALHLSTELVYLVTALSLAVVNFVVFRLGVFHSADPAEERR